MGVKLLSPRDLTNLVNFYVKKLSQHRRLRQQMILAADTYLHTWPTHLRFDHSLMPSRRASHLPRSKADIFTMDNRIISAPFRMADQDNTNS